MWSLEVEQGRTPPVLHNHHELAREPLISHQVVIDLIAASTTRTGLSVQAGLDPSYYPTGVKISNQQLAELPVYPHNWHGQWNFTITPN